MADDVQIALSPDEALVLFDWLHNLENAGATESIVMSKGELVALRNLSCLLERVLVEPFQDDYSDLVAAARRRITGAEPSD